MLSEALTNLQTFFKEHEKTGVNLRPEYVQTLVFAIGRCVDDAKAMEGSAVAPIFKLTDGLPPNVVFLAAAGAPVLGGLE